MARTRPGQAANPAPPTVQRIRVRFAKRGRLRFLSHRDVARSVERAVRRAGVPVSHSHGFNPHPRISWIGAAPTGSASEAEYLEIGLTRPVDPAELVAALDAALPPGLDILDAVEAGGASLADRVDASRWRIELPGVDAGALAAAVTALLERDELIVERVTPSGRKQVDVRAALVSADVRAELLSAVPDETPAVAPDGAGGDAPSEVSRSDDGAAAVSCAILTAVVRQMTPAVRPDDVLGALDVVAGLTPPVPARAIRLAQGLLDDRGALADPLGSGRVTTGA